MKESTAVVNRHHRVPYDVYVGRGSIWGNPFPIGAGADREQVIRRYEGYLRENQELLEELPSLQGRTLACYCAPAPCHGHIIAAFADSLASTGSIPDDSVSDRLFPGPRRQKLSFG